jgi:hypothetical protein|tara:strand:+ start:44 stop:778 length:735 start_codon:yes stop_codon:yes gene_type:complete
MEGILQLPYVQNLITQYGVNKALELLGLDKEENNPLIFGMPENMNIPFMPKKFNMLPTLARTGINAALKGGFSSAALPLAAAGGLYYLARMRDPLNPNSQNYNPYLRDELDYLSSNNLIGTNIGPGQGFTRYNEDSVLRGKNVVSGFGTNSYIDMLQKYKTNMENNKKISAEGKARKLKKVNEEIAAYNLDKVNKGLAEPDYQGGGDGASQSKTGGGTQLGSGMTTEQHRAFRSMAKGGLASLL